MRPSRVCPETSFTSAMSPTLTLATLRSDTSTTASIGSSPTICAISLPAKANAEVPTSEISVMTPSQGARDDAAIALGLGGRKRGLRGLVLRFQIVAARAAAMALVSTSRRLASSSTLRCSSSACACSTCASRASSDRMAMTSPFFTMRAAADPQLLKHAVGAREGHDLAVGLGAAGQHELAAVRRPRWSRSPPRGIASRPLLRSPRSAALLSADSCGMRWPDSIHKAAAATRPTAVMRLAFMTTSPRPQRQAARGHAAGAARHP